MVTVVDTDDLPGGPTLPTCHGALHWIFRKGKRKDIQPAAQAKKPGIYPGGSDGKESACTVGDPFFIPGLGRSPGEGTGYLLQYSCLENSLNRGV